MTVRRALIREADLRRWARVSREEGVSIRGRVAMDGSITISLSPAKAADDDAGDLDDRLGKFAAL